MVFTGSYDHTVRGWDLRSGDSAFRLNHGAPVEAILVFPSGGTCLTAGGNFVKVWDLLRGGKPFCGFSNHQKTITGLAFDGSHKRILSGGLDRLGGCLEMIFVLILFLSLSLSLSLSL